MVPMVPLSAYGSVCGVATVAAVVRVILAMKYWRYRGTIMYCCTAVFRRFGAPALSEG